MFSAICMCLRYTLVCFFKLVLSSSRDSLKYSVVFYLDFLTLGRNDYGQLGLGHTLKRDNPTLVPLKAKYIHLHIK